MELADSNQTARLDTLPDEILVRILNFLSSDVRHLFRIACVSRRFSNLVETGALWSEAQQRILTCWGGDRYCTKWFDSKSGPKQFVKTALAAVVTRTYEHRIHLNLVERLPTAVICCTPHIRTLCNAAEALFVLHFHNSSRRVLLVFGAKRTEEELDQLMDLQKRLERSSFSVMICPVAALEISSPDNETALILFSFSATSQASSLQQVRRRNTAIYGAQPGLDYCAVHGDQLIRFLHSTPFLYMMSHSFAEHCRRHRVDVCDGIRVDDKVIRSNLIMVSRLIELWTWKVELADQSEPGPVQRKEGETQCDDTRVYHQEERFLLMMVGATLPSMNVELRTAEVLAEEDPSAYAPPILQSEKLTFRNCRPS